MGTTLIETRKRGYDPDKMSDQERTFVLALMGLHEFHPTEAARQAKYKHPSVAAAKLMKRPRIKAALGKAMREREERCELTADDVLNYLRTALFFNPLRYFRPGPDGGWLITDIDQLPEEVGRLIEKMEVKEIRHDDGRVENVFKVEFVSHATALTLAMKHTTVEKSEVLHSINWDEYYSSHGGEDLIEVEIEKG